MREVVRSVASNDLSRISLSGGLFESLGVECCRARVPAEDLATGIRVGARALQSEVHRALVDSGVTVGTDTLVALLERFGEAGELAVEAACRGYVIVSVSGNDMDEPGGRLMGALMDGSVGQRKMADEAGWGDDSFVAAIVADHDVAVSICTGLPVVVAHFVRTHDVVLGVPVKARSVATTWRGRLAVRL